MQLTSFRVTKFKSVLDSGEVRLTPLTVIVGKNESGKTSLLKALHKLNPATPEPYNIANEWPRGHRDSRSKDHVPCWATLTLTEEEQSKVAAADMTLQPLAGIRVGRTFSGSLEGHADGW